MAKKHKKTKKQKTYLNYRYLKTDDYYFFNGVIQNFDIKYAVLT